MDEDLSRDASPGGRASLGGPGEDRGVDRKRLRVALVTDVVWPWSRGGAEARFAEFLERAGDNNVDVVVYTNRWWEGPPPDGDGVSYRAIGPRPSLYRNGRRRLLPAVTFALNAVKVAFGTFDVLVANQAPVLRAAYGHGHRARAPGPCPPHRHRVVRPHGHPRGFRCLIIL